MHGPRHRGRCPHRRDHAGACPRTHAVSRRRGGAARPAIDSMAAKAMPRGAAIARQMAPPTANRSSTPATMRTAGALADSHAPFRRTLGYAVVVAIRHRDGTLDPARNRGDLVVLVVHAALPRELLPRAVEVVLNYALKIALCLGGGECPFRHTRPCRCDQQWRSCDSYVGHRSIAPHSRADRYCPLDTGRSGDIRIQGHIAVRQQQRR